MNVSETSVERRKQFLEEFYPERIDELKNLAIKAWDGVRDKIHHKTDNSAENFVNVCLYVNAKYGKLDQEVFYCWLWQYASIHY